MPQQHDQVASPDAAASDAARRAVRPRLGIIGGGQLAKMTASAAQRIGCDVVVLERAAPCPAGQMVEQLLIGDWDDPGQLARLAERVDCVTLENEFVDADSLAALEAAGAALAPSASTLRMVQDKMLQKRYCDDAGIDVPRWAKVDTPADVLEAGRRFGFPLLLKARRNAYDGKGNATVRSEQDVRSAWDALHRAGGLYVEEFCPFTAELAVIVTRGRDGACVTYPVVESVQRNHVCHVVKAPADVPARTAEHAADLARRFVEKIGGVGSFGVEMFLLPDGRVFVNEIAPRVHNTGHYTIEACVTSQFENHVRAVLGWPLGSTRLLAPAAVMVNLLGRMKTPGVVRGLGRALAVPGASVHLYGKLSSGPGRKMGHVTVVGQHLPQTLDAALAAAGEISFGDES